LQAFTLDVPRVGAAVVEHPVRIGTSGWNYADWRSAVYPKGLASASWLEYYASLFDTVEVNATFYRLPAEKTVARWAEQTPPGFVFAVKASRYLTHVKRLIGTNDGVTRFLTSLAPLERAGKLGPVLWQLPGTLQRDDDRLVSFLDALPEGRHCVEFRHPSWFDETVTTLLSERGVALVIPDHPDRRYQLLELTSDWTYVRLHRGCSASGDYSHRELERWGRRIAEWRARADVYCYFNNDWQGFAVKDATELIAWLSARQMPRARGRPSEQRASRAASRHRASGVQLTDGSSPRSGDHRAR
jgi:uncharacterized protein YecE (DUF72 family)